MPLKMNSFKVGAYMPQNQIRRKPNISMFDLREDDMNPSEKVRNHGLKISFSKLLMRLAN